MNMDPRSSNNEFESTEPTDDAPWVDHDQIDSAMWDDYDAREVIAEALYDKTYFAYAVHPDQIEIGDVDPARRNTQAFKQAVEIYGWPNAKDDNGIEPPFTYGSDGEPDYTEFRSAFLSKHDNPKMNLANFRFWLVAEPNDLAMSDFRTMVDAYGSHPALQRLYALMPELMEATHHIVKDVYERNDDVGAFSQELSASVNDDLVKAIYLIHQVAGRVLKADDTQRHRSILLPGMSSTTQPVTNAHDALRA